MKTQDLSVRDVKCPDGKVRQLFGVDNKDNPTRAVVFGEDGGKVFDIDELEETKDG